MKRKMLFIVVGALFVYVLVFGVLIFSFKKEVSEQYRATHPVERFYSDEIGPDRAVLIDDPQDSAIVRVNMIENAQKTIDISYYSMESGKVTNTFWGLLIEAARKECRIYPAVITEENTSFMENHREGRTPSSRCLGPFL